ncbi:MAG: hypothetical protein FWE98_03225 [Oscillospiraceae bacterium]|nr:hypothetical protein [Oscillospiraceae bacterium]
MKNALDFKIPFCGFAGTNFINCFASVYMFLEGIDIGGSDYSCRQLEGKGCNSCGNCAAGGGTPISRQEKYFFLFDTMCGRSALRCRFDDAPTEWQKRIGAWPNSYETDETIDFLFGFAGYDYRKITGDFKAVIAAAIDAGKPVIAKVRAGEWPFRVITGYDGNKLLCPSFINAQHPPKKAPKPAELEALYVAGKKIAPRCTVMDGLRRIAEVMEYNLSEELWEGYIKKIGMYGEDGIGKANTEEKQARMERLARTMEYTWNCHNFAQVFRNFRDDGGPPYEGMESVERLRAAELKPLWDEISGPCCGYTHDLAWALLGLSETADWKGHVYRTGYFGEMAELALVQLRKNDEQALACIKQAIQILQEQ